MKIYVYVAQFGSGTEQCVVDCDDGDVVNAHSPEEAARYVKRLVSDARSKQSNIKCRICFEPPCDIVDAENFKPFKVSSFSGDGEAKFFNAYTE